MRDAALDNPIHAALRSLHRGLAQRAGAVLRHPPEFAPFLGMPQAEAWDERAADLVAPDDTAYLLGVAPRPSPRWQIEAYAPLAQMVCEAPIEVVDGPGMIELGPAHRDEVLALTARVYPHYFRRRTMELGRYFGIYVDGRLAAMIGERLGSDDTREMSAICTDPDFLGRGYARRLTAMLTNHTLARGALPFLHVSYQNSRALQLYERMGYRLRRDIGFWSLRRAPMEG